MRKDLPLIATLWSLMTGLTLQAQAPDVPGWAAEQMLRNLDSVAAAERRASVETALQEYPGSAEVFLITLATRAYLEQLWASPAAAAFMPGPAAGGSGTTWGGRSTCMEGRSGGPEARLFNGVPYEPLFCSSVSPLILDLDGNGVAGVPGGRWAPHPGAEIDAHTLAAFDINGDGFAELLEWVDGSDGLLVLPETPDKVTDGTTGLAWSGPLSGKDLLGTAGGWADGYAKIEILDADDDGTIAGKELDALYVWRDADRDAAIQPGELARLAQYDITAITIPEPGQGASSFVRSGAGQPMWDWWPSYACVKRLSESGYIAPPERLALGARVLGPDVLPWLQLFTLDAEGWVPQAAIENASIDWRSLRLLALAPDGSNLVLYDRETAPPAIAAGMAVRLWVLRKDDGKISAKRIQLPIAELVQGVHISPERLLVTGDAGTKLILVDLVTSDRTVLAEPAAGSPGFRGGELAFRGRGGVLLSGYFFNAKQESSNARLARYEGAPPDAALVAAADLDTADAEVRKLGRIAMSWRAHEALAFFVVEDSTSDAQYDLVASKDGAAAVADRGVRLGVIAGSGECVLYLKEAADGGLPEVRVYDATAGASAVLGSGDYVYAYLADEGRVAFATSIDWATGAMTFLRAEVGAKAGFTPLLTAPGIGAVRIAEDGESFAYLGARGLYLGMVTRTPPFVRGNANASPVSAANPRASIDIADAVFILSYLFAKGTPPPCFDAADANDDGKNDLADAIAILQHLFAASGPLREPFRACGPDPTPDALGCVSFPACR